MGRADAKAGLSDPAVLDGKAVAQQIKGTPGITGLSPLSVHSGEEVWHLNTLGCCRSNPVPTNRLITVDPNLRLQVENCKYPIADLKRSPSMATPWEVVRRFAIDNLQFSICNTLTDPVTTDPKGEALASRQGNTPTPVIVSQIMVSET